MQQNSVTAIEVKISTVVAVSLVLHELSLREVEQALQQLTGGTPDYFANEFAVIDLSACDCNGLHPDWPALISLFKSYGLNPVAVRHVPPQWEEDILAHGLSIDVVVRAPAQSEHKAEEMQQEVAATGKAEPLRQSEGQGAPEAMPALIVDTPVRAGQRIYARGRDLVVTAVVNSGAELIADGSIHVYAPLRGRALAGASGNPSARIFALSMEAELVSIAGTYRTFEDGLPSGLTQKPVQVRLAGDCIDLAPLLQFRA